MRIFKFLRYKFYELCRNVSTQNGSDTFIRLSYLKIFSDIKTTLFHNFDRKIYTITFVAR